MAPAGQLCSRVLSSITIEPMVFLYYLSVSISGFGSNNLLLQKACQPDSITEPDFNEPCQGEVTAEKIVADINTWRTCLDSLLPLFFIIFLGTWSDTHGKRRKPLMFIPLVGDMIRNIGLMLCVYYWEVSPPITGGIESFVRGCTGGGICFSFGMKTYMSDVTTVEERTVRLGVISASVFIGAPIGVILGGELRMKFGFFYLFLFCFVTSTVALILGILLMKDTACEESQLKTFEGVCDSNHFKRCVKTFFKKRPGNKRQILFLMSSVSPLFTACFTGEFAVMYLFFRYKFHMGEVEFGHYCAFKFLTIFIGTFISLMICSKMLKMTDAAIGWCGNSTQIVAAVGLCFAEYEWQLYFFPILDVMHGAPGTAASSIISKTVDGNELGQVFSVISAINVVAPLAVFPAYNMLYKYTIQIMPGAFYLLSVVLSVFMMILFSNVYILEKRKRKLDSEKEKEETDNCEYVPLLSVSA